MLYSGDNNRDLSLPKVSVVIPIYNAQDWIEETLRSVLEQTYNHGYLEIVVIDDGSTDQSVAVVESVLKNASIEYSLARTCHGGPSKARNIGWQRAKGEWIQFLDADDLLHPQKIEIQAFETCSLPLQVAVVYSDWQRLALVGQKWQPVGEVGSPVIEDNPITELLKTENTLSTGCQLVRRAWLEKVSGFDERHRLIEDVELVLKIAMEGGNFYYVQTDFPLFFYRQRNDSLSRRSDREFVEGCLRNAKLAEAYLRSNGELTPAQASIIATVYFQCARYFASTDWEEFKSLAGKIESLIPNFLPPKPSHLRFVSRLIGYRRAERVALVYRQFKKRFILKQKENSNAQRSKRFSKSCVAQPGNR